MKKTIVAIVFTLGMLSTAATSFAAGTAEQRKACTPDVFRLCSSEIPFVSKIVACLQKKRTQLSPGCRTVFSKRTTQEASAGRTRSVAGASEPVAKEWCNFREAAHDKDQQKWLEWCGSNAHE